jgi:hypothetical protein
MRRPWLVLGHSGMRQRERERGRKTTIKTYIYKYCIKHTVKLDAVNYINNAVYVRWIPGTPMTLASL